MAKLPVAKFLEKRISEFNSAIDVRKGTGFEQLFFKPLQFMLQPMVDELQHLTTAQSFLRILNTADPDAFSEEAVDALAYNYFVKRSPGGSASGSARVYYSEPMNREWPTAGITITGSNGILYSNPAPFAVNKAITGQQIENGYYYYDIPVMATELGAGTSMAAGGLVSIDNDSEAISVTNKSPITGGMERETNNQLILRVRKSIAVRDLVTGKGFQATIFERFAGSIRELQTIGFGDQEMMRDIVYNTHIGGRVDAYFKANTVSQGSKTFIGLFPDYTRQLRRTTNLTLNGSVPSETGDGNFDITNDMFPIVTQIKTPKSATYYGTVTLNQDSDLSQYHRIKMTIDAETREFSLRSLGAPSKTTRSDIINKINAEFDEFLCSAYNRSIKILSIVTGLQSVITIAHPDSRYDPDTSDDLSALTVVFGLSSPTTFYGDGPITFADGTDYTYETDFGTITRKVSTNYLVGTETVPQTGATIEMISGLPKLIDSATDILEDVRVYDIVTINPNPGAGESSADYRVIVTEDNNTLVLDVIPGDKGYWTPTTNTPRLENGIGTEGDIYLVGANGSANFGAGSISFSVGDYVVYQSVYGIGLWVKLVNPLMSDFEYVIRRTGIKDGETVYVEYWFNPISIDVGPKVMNTDYYENPPVQYRGIRPGRGTFTILDTALLRINSIQIIDPITLEPTGEVLATRGGWGDGGWGEGPYGYGNGSDYYVVVNSPHERFSAFEDSVIVFHPAFIGLSVRVDYDYAPECVSLHNFVRSESERVLDGDILIKHFLPAYVGGSITYKVDSTDTTIPTNEALTTQVKDFITQQAAGVDLKISDVYQFLARATDPFDKYKSYVKPFSLQAIIHHVDGTTEFVSSDDILKIPTLFPFPKETTRPLSARITHWIGDNIELIRES